MDEVRVPKRYMIGEMNRGWYAAMTTLNFERTGIDNAARQIGVFDRFIAMARDLKFNGESILNSGVTRHQLADLRVTLEIDRMLAYRVAAMQAAGEVPQAEGAMSGWRVLHTSKYWLWPTFARALGPYIGLHKPEPRAPGNGIYGTHYMLSRMSLAAAVASRSAQTSSPGAASASRDRGLTRCYRALLCYPCSDDLQYSGHP